MEAKRKRRREGGSGKGRGARVKAGDSTDLSEERWGREGELTPFPREAPPYPPGA